MDTVKDIFSITKGQKVNTVYEKPQPNSLRYIQIDDLRNNNQLKYTTDLDLVKVNEADIIIAWDGANAGTIGFRLNGIIGSTLARLSVKKELQSTCNSSYLGYFLSSKFNYLKNTATGAIIPHISRNALEELTIPIPGLEIQNKIVAILDKAKTILDKRKKTTKIYEELLKSCFIEMFGDPVYNPKGWKQVTLSEICHKITDGTHKTPNYLSEGVKFISAKNITNNFISWKDIRYISEDESNLINSRCNPEFEDILLTKSGSLGQAALIDVDFKFSLFESLALIKYKRDVVLPAFLITYLMSDGVAYFYKQRHKGVAVKHLHLIDIKSIPVYLPPIEIQKGFESKYHQLGKLSAQIKYAEIKCDELLRSLSQQVFSERITIDIDAELDALLNAIDIDKKDDDNKIDTVSNDITFMQRLIDKLQEQDFENSTQYERAKYIAFRIMKEESNLIKQQFSSVDKKVKLVL